MEKYRYSDEELKLLENSPIPFAIYQSVEKRAVTIVLSEGFFELFYAVRIVLRVLPVSYQIIGGFL